MNSLVFISLVAIGEIVVVWLAYRVGFDNGWLNGWDESRTNR
jgi:hypothetical protein